MKTYAMKIIAAVFLLTGFFSTTYLSNPAYSEETINSGLSIASVRAGYSSNDNTLRIIFLLLNTGKNNITVLTENLGIGLNRFTPVTQKPKNEYLCQIDTGMKMNYQGYDIIQSLYKFAPVTLRPNEGAHLNIRIKTKFNIDKNTDIIIRYRITEEFGKRFNIWHGSVETGPIKPKIK